MASSRPPGTKNLLSALKEFGARKLVLVSSIAVYAYDRIPPYSVIDEDSPVVDGQVGANVYATMKRRQKLLVESYASNANLATVSLRPGLVYDSKRLEPGHAGIVRGGIGVVIKNDARVPVAQVEGLAKAIIDSGAHDDGSCRPCL